LEGLLGSSEELVSGIIGYLSLAIEVMAAVLIGITIVIAFISALKILRKPTKERTLSVETTRIALARSLLLVLDFVVASDILKTILAPSATEVLLLAVIVAVRIALSWSLSKELDRHTEDLTNQ